MSFDDLPMVQDEEEQRRVHNETAMYFLSSSGVAHAEMTCHLAASEDWRKMIQNKRWRVARDKDVMRLKASWCSNCCAV